MSQRRTTQQALLAAVAAWPLAAFAHNGGLDPYGCHYYKEAGSYHCHVGFLAGFSFRSRADMLDSTENWRKVPRPPPAAPQAAPPMATVPAACLVIADPQQRLACLSHLTSEEQAPTDR